MELLKPALQMRKPFTKKPFALLSIGISVSFILRLKMKGGRWQAVELMKFTQGTKHIGVHMMSR